jgi:Cof subfamily protein (haloacid dehalogenase superfamily)
MIRLIAIDLDGTLFNSQQQISTASRAALQLALAAGKQLILASGRGSIGMNMTLELLGMDLPYISSAGAAVFSGKNGRIISARTFHAKAELGTVIAFARQTNAGLVADLPDGTLWYGPDMLIESLDAFTAASMKESVRTFEPERDFDRPILKMSLAGGMDLLNSAAGVLAKCTSLHSVYAGLHYVDLTAHGVDKGSALKIFADQAGIIPEEIAAIGDQPIDLPMLEYAGLPIAMQNAPEVVKQAARWVVPTNDDDGVVWALTRILGG